MLLPQLPFDSVSSDTVLKKKKHVKQVGPKINDQIIRIINMYIGNYFSVVAVRPGTDSTLVSSHRHHQLIEFYCDLTPWLFGEKEVASRR
ncbi:hypothetical protein GWI33_011842 [Rhynchophorus ferrugineus]|uniref:Uncharacterized protein n=1 Tax=Rhynchophorus ferrugineus TaxID=354439 RepID=A0A834IAB9_RHYFE|nr:hypothetical protein GWI33_011842 [Rhynchophorus ferrugineus]